MQENSKDWSRERYGVWYENDLSLARIQQLFLHRLFKRHVKRCKRSAGDEKKRERQRNKKKGRRETEENKRTTR